MYSLRELHFFEKIAHVLMDMYSNSDSEPYGSSSDEEHESDEEPDFPPEPGFGHISSSVSRVESNNEHPWLAGCTAAADTADLHLLNSEGTRLPAHSFVLKAKCSVSGSLPDRLR